MTSVRSASGTLPARVPTASTKDPRTPALLAAARDPLFAAQTTQAYHRYRDDGVAASAKQGFKVHGSVEQANRSSREWAKAASEFQGDIHIDLKSGDARLEREALLAVPGAIEDAHCFPARGRAGIELHGADSLLDDVIALSRGATDPAVSALADKILARVDVVLGGFHPSANVANLVSQALARAGHPASA